MGKIEVVDATKQHAWFVAEHMREADRLEMQASGVSPLRACMRGVETSTWAKTALLDQTPVCIFGVAPTSILSGTAAPWLLGTDMVHDIRVRFIRESRRYVDETLRSHRTLRNYVDVRNTLSIRWLKWLGFELGPAVAVGVKGEPFYPFELRALEAVADV